MKLRKVFTLMAVLVFAIAVVACDTKKDELSRVDEIIM